MEDEPKTWRLKKRNREGGDWRETVEAALESVEREMPNDADRWLYNELGWESGKRVRVMQAVMEKLWLAILDTPLAALLMQHGEHGDWARGRISKIWKKMRSITKTKRGQRKEDEIKQIVKTMNTIEQNILLTTNVLELSPGEVLTYLITIEKSLKEELDSRSAKVYDNSYTPPDAIQKLRGIPYPTPEQERELQKWTLNNLELKHNSISIIRNESPSVQAVIHSIESLRSSADTLDDF